MKKEGDTIGDVTGTRSSGKTSLAAAILKGMDVLQGKWSVTAQCA